MVKSIYDFTEKTAIVVGGSSGIGFETVKQFLQSGARVFIAARGKPKILPAGATFISCDVRDKQQVLSMVDKVLEKMGQIDILVNSMGITFSNLVEEISFSEWQDVIATNMTGVFLTCQAVLPSMKDRAQGKIVNVSSVAGRHRSLTAGSHYVASKAAVIGFSRQLAYEVASFGINVNIHCPSQTITPMLEKGTTSQQRKALASSIPMRRLANVEEQAAPILFLCSDNASYLCGASLDVNGGQF